MKSFNKKKILTILIVYGIVLSIFAGGTIAYLNWRTSNKNYTWVTFTADPDRAFICEADVGGAISPDQVPLAPATCNDSTHVIKRELKIKTTIMNELPVHMDLWIDINSIAPELSATSNFKYSITTDSNSCTNGVITSGTFQGKTANDVIEIFSQKEYPGTTEETYYLYIWLDAAETNTNTMNKSFNLSINGSCENTVAPKPNSPVLDDGMIPIKISADGVATTVSNTDSTWYNYDNKEWANAVLVKSSGTQTRDYYKSNTGVTVAEDDILAYYVWIPRYKYKIWTIEYGSAGNEQTIDITFESPTDPVTEGSQVGDYITHPAFVWDGSTIAGIWVGKFETGHSTLVSGFASSGLGCTDENCSNAYGLIIKPNVVPLNNNNVSNFFYASRTMTGVDNPFGLSSSTTDTHMMKNSEWDAVAYLSHSKYGINQEIYINNAIITGRSGGAVSGNVNKLATQFPDNETSTLSYNNYGYYTWSGQETTSTGTIGSYVSNRALGTNASTTGNVTGVYDMSGGFWEYVMGNYYGYIESSGFSQLPNSKYYDTYNPYISGSHANKETKNWYSDYFGLDTGSRWLLRGGGNYQSSEAGIWAIMSESGRKYSYVFRAVAIVEN